MLRVEKIVLYQLVDRARERGKRVVVRLGMPGTKRSAERLRDAILREREEERSRLVREDR